MNIKILAFDLDGTTVVGHKDMPEENKIALTEAEAKGVYLVPCTGRIKSFLPADVSALPNIRYVISSNGASVDDIITGENIYKALIPVSLTKKVQEIINCYDLYQELYVDGAAYTLGSILTKQEQTLTSSRYQSIISLQRNILSLRISMNLLRKLR